MMSASGLIYRDGGFIEGSASVVRGRVVISESPDPGAEVTGIILPRTVNCHSHLGDGFIKVPDRCSVSELVAPPNGLKHRMLRSVSEQEQVFSMRESISVMARTGTSHFIDFRENGLEGARRLLMASLGTGVAPVILGRPDGNDVNEISALLSVADGIGMSAVSDLGHDILSEIAGHARSTERIFAIHASEVQREDIDLILGLRPDLLVHMVMADDGDLEACAGAGVPVAICPGSNAYFGLRPPVRRMLDAGITLCLGSDNAMLSAPDMLAQMKLLRGMYPSAAISDAEILEITFSNGGKVLNSLPGLGGVNSSRPDFFVLVAPVDDPCRSLLGSGNDDIRLFAMGGIP